ncbi:unnamed protein product [Paramecium sonneborni]|uniref:Uncharacterized protein n=1 Tax=Paramecium sonneborni TaxID=65129 RepID=A0A8S1KVK2_9CILI|nr:unnamed protein product [Paramecium sonneborni]
MNKLKIEYQTKDDLKNGKPSTIQVNVCVEKQLSNIYKEKDGHFLCISCLQEVKQENIYDHLFDPIHILKLQEYFIDKNNNNKSKKEKVLHKMDNKDQSLKTQQIKKEHFVQKEQKQQPLVISSQDQNMNKNWNNNCLENYIESLLYDLKSIGKISLSLIVSILVKTYCTITDLLEMKFSQILDRSNFYYLNINNAWDKSYLILKQGFPDYLQEFIKKNSGSNKPIIKLLGENKRQYLSKQLWLGCQTISIQTNDLEYINFLQGLTLKKLKKITIERITKKTTTYIDDSFSYSYSSEEEEKVQHTQNIIKVQEDQKIEQTKIKEKKPVIKIIIRQNQVQNQKYEIGD